jgi:Ca2+-binding EF-hand superfamily protein
MTDDMNRMPKKSEMLEVRLDYETKRDFLAACRSAGRTASDVVRENVRAFIDAQGRAAAPPEPEKKGAAILAFIPAPLRRKRFIAIGAGALALTTFAALPSAADPNFRASFDRLDTNHDGKLTPDEFGRGPSGNLTVFENATVEGRNLPARDVALRTSTDYGDLTTPQSSARAARAPAPDHAGFARFDADADSGITFAEYSARYLAMLRNGFEALDVNADGRVTSEEFQRPISISADSVTAPPRSDFESLPQGLDRNADGVVTYEEYIE